MQKEPTGLSEQLYWIDIDGPSYLPGPGKIGDRGDQFLQQDMQWATFPGLEEQLGAVPAGPAFHGSGSCPQDQHLG